MPKKIYGLTNKDRGTIQKGITRAKNNPLGERGAKTERRPHPTIFLEKRYFAIKQTAKDKIKIIDGMDVDSGYCGYVQCNKLAAQQIESPELTITESCYIFRKSVGSYTDSVLSSAAVTFEILTDFPSYTAGTEYELKSVVTFADGAITNFSDMPLPYRIDITGVCDT